MKILLDESLPRKLRDDFGTDHDVWTVRDKGWLGKKNGVLLNLMTGDGFDLFVTIDRNMPYQQNLTKLPLTIFVLCAKDSTRETLQALIPKIFKRFEEGDLNRVIEIK
jgi:hypothetical protein